MSSNETDTRTNKQTSREAAGDLSIEKAFAIEGTPEAIWDALWADLAQGDESLYELEGSSWPTRFQLRVDMSGMPCLLTYTLRPMEPDGMTEVAAALEPLSKRYSLYYLVTFGHIKRNYEMLLVEGLANLKAHVEGTQSQGVTPEA
jgi:hypothetical protein